MSTFERYLTLWVALCIVAGIALGHLMPPVSDHRRSRDRARQSAGGGLIWLMIVPMLIKIDFAALGRVREHWRGIGVTLFINWAVKPFSMAALGWLFIGYLFRPYLPAEQINSYIAGLILLAAAPCTRDGVRVEQPDQGRAAFHAVASGAQRHHHGVRLRADCRAAARPVGDHGAVGHAGAVGGALHRGAGARAQVLRRKCVATVRPAADASARHCSCVAARCWRLGAAVRFQGDQIIAQPLVIVLWRCRS